MAAPLLDWLVGVKARDDRGTLAALRSALCESGRERAWPFLAPFGGVGNGWKARAVQVVAGGFADNPTVDARGNFGDSCLRLVRGAGEIGTDPMSDRFSWLLQSDEEEIVERIVSLLRRLAAGGIPVNWFALYEDILDWPSGRPQERWAIRFWRGAP